jgi:putative ATP-dependent endonuclease of OLD family
LLVDELLDAGLHRFVATFLSLESLNCELRLTLRKAFGKSSRNQLISLTCNGTKVDDEFKTEEIFKKIRSSRCLLFHNSTQPRFYYFRRSRFEGLIADLSPQEAEKVKKANDRLADMLKRSAQRHQKDILELLGRLEEKYHVALSVPPLEMESIPFTVSLGDKKSTVPLDDWGSGTQNRTLILLHLLRAKKNRESASESNRITPILVIEEPECFLHPSAQAEFGKMLQDLAEEFSVQILTTTHSPYMLSLNNPASNILLRRRLEKGRLSSTEKVETDGDNWMEPFGLALGIDNSAFSNWRHVLFKSSKQIILVEGETDKKYLELFRDPMHKEDALSFEGEIFPYGGVGFFGNTILVRFVMNRFTKFVITYDLDHDASITKSLQNLGLKKGVHFFPVGIDSSGKRDIEGLLPGSLRAVVYAQNPDAVAAAMSGNKEERDAGRQKLKELLLAEFTLKARPEKEYYGEFYRLSKALNGLLK